MEIPKQGDTVVRTQDGARFSVAEVVDAGGESLYRLKGEQNGETLEIEGGAFVKAHEESRAKFETAW